MLKHDWMRNRERRTHRIGRDEDGPEVERVDEGDEPEPDLELSPSPFLLEGVPAADDQLEAEVPAPEDELAPEEPPEDDLWEEPPAEAYEEDQVIGVPAEPAGGLAVPGEPTAIESPAGPEDIPAAEAETVAPEPPEGETAPGPVAEASQARAEAHRPRPSPREVAAGIDVPLRTMRDRLEQILAGQNQLPLDIDARQEVSAKAASTPREQRLGLVQRLLDPTLNLQEVATLLDVCTTTVRRYTDRGVLRCYRTPGNQRRFHLSDVLDFMERQHRGEL